MKFEDEYLDVLQNIEAEIIGAYRQYPELTDLDALEALEFLLRCYNAEVRGRQPPTSRLSELSQLVADGVKDACEFRLGRAKTPEAGDSLFVYLGIESITVSEIIACLKRIRKSVEFWNEANGQRGYLSYVSRFIR